MKKLVVTLTMTLEDDAGEPLHPDRLRLMGDVTQNAIMNRLMGEGFLPGNVVVEDYSLTSEMVD